MSPIARKTVLYIEDNPVNVYLVQAIFEARSDVQLLTAPCGSKGLDLARQHRPRLILLDMNLPDMDGAEFLELLHADETIAKIPVVIVSADALEDQRAHLQALGIADYVTKPFDIDQFERLVDRHLNG